MIKCKRKILALSNACSVTGGSRNILRLWGQVVLECLEANNAKRQQLPRRELHLLAPVGLDPESTVGREQEFFLIAHQGILLERFEVLAIRRH